MTKIVLIVAVAEDGTIGDNNSMPWHLPADLKWFVQQTKGRPVVMGRRTFESLGRPLPGRRNIVLTRSRDWSADGVEVVHTKDEAIALGSGDSVDSLMIIGGAEIFRLFEDIANAAYVTLIHGSFGGDTKYLPALGWVDAVKNGGGKGDVELEKEVKFLADEKNAYNMNFYEFKFPKQPERSPVKPSVSPDDKAYRCSVGLLQRFLMPELA